MNQDDNCFIITGIRADVFPIGNGQRDDAGVLGIDRISGITVRSQAMPLSDLSAQSSGDEPKVQKLDRD